MRKTSICELASRMALTFGYGGDPAFGSSEEFSMHRSIVTVSPTLIAFGLHETYPRQTVGENEAAAVQTLMCSDRRKEVRKFCKSGEHVTDALRVVRSSAHLSKRSAIL